jgi:hypothetical protein
MAFLPVPPPAVAALVGGAVFFVRGFKVWNERRLILNTPTARIRSMAMGLVELTGTARQRSAVAAPFSGKSCTFWQVDISSRTKDGWRVIHHNASGYPFFLEDGTGTALVYPQGAECKLVPGVEEVCTGPFLPPCYADYIKAQSLPLLGIMSVGQMRFRERVIEDGQRVFVLGTAMPRSQSVSISDAAAEQATGTDGAPARLATLDHATVAVVRKGENEPTFVISQESERTLSLEMGIQSTAQLVGGPLLSLFGLGWIVLTLASRHGVH